MPGFVQYFLDNLPEIETVIASNTTAVVIVERVQGEGGARLKAC
jgi:acetylornithine/succinyldiaminopimelate/putrescine aminotransferase